LAPDGRVFFVDEIKDAWRNEASLREDFVPGAAPVVRRSLNDGREFLVVKIFWDPAELTDRLRELGWSIEVHPVGPFFWACGERSAR
jgi:hypothetical protein